MDPATAAVLVTNFAPILLNWINQAIEGGSMTPEQATQLWQGSKADWDASFAKWQASQT